MIQKRYKNSKSLRIEKFVVLLIMIFCLNSYGQQRPFFTQYMYNTMSVNSGYVGSTDNMEITSLVRSQWGGFDGAPETQTINFISPLGNKGLAMGVNIVNDKIGPVSQQSIEGSLAYKIRVNRNSELSFGLNFGGNFFSADWSKGRYQSTDVVFNENINSKFLARLGVGLYYYTDTYYVGFSIPNFLKSNFYNDINESVGTEDLTYYGIAGIVLEASENIKFKPAVLTTITPGAPVVVDLSGTVFLNDKFSLGLSHRFGDAISGLLGIEISNTLTFGYSYDLTSATDLQNYNSGTHEVFLKYSINKRGDRQTRRLF